MATQHLEFYEGVGDEGQKTQKEEQVKENGRIQSGGESDCGAQWRCCVSEEDQKMGDGIGEI